MMYTAPTKVLALCSAAGIASAAILIKANGLDQDLSLFNDPIDDNTNAIVLKQAGDAIPDTVFLEGSQLRFNLAADSANNPDPPSWTGYIPAPYSNWSQVYTRPVLEGQDNGPGLSINNDSFLTWNGTDDGFFACLLDDVFTLFFGDDPEPNNQPGQQCLNITLNATNV